MKRGYQLWSLFLNFLLVSGVSIPTQHVDVARTGTNTLEYALTPNTVSSTTFGKLFTVSLDSAVAGQPLYVQNVLINGTTLYNVVYVYTNNGKVDNSPSSIIAIDADKGTILWKTALRNNTISMTGTPVIDLNNWIIYVVSKDTVSSGNVLLWALDIRMGTILNGSPIIVTATVPGTGLDAVDGQITFGPGHEDSRGALLFTNGTLYIGFGGGLPGFHNPIYHGWLMSYTYNVNNGFTQQNVWISTPASNAGGVWQAGKGFSTDGTFIYASTGYGTFNTATGDMAMSFIKFNPDLTVADFFTPAGEAAFSANQQDAGNAGMVILPGTTNLLFAGGTKYGAAHLINSTNMGKFVSTAANTCLQTATITSSAPVGQEPIAWDGGDVNKRNIFLWPTGSAVLQFNYSNTAFAAFETQKLSTAGGSLTASSNGQTNGILWAIGNDNTVYSFEGVDISQTLWTSQQVPARDALGFAVGHFQFPMQANGKLYVPVSTPDLVVYGLLAPTQTALQFLVQPLGSTGTAQVNLGDNLQAFQVAVVDINGNVVPTAYSITLSISGTFGTQPVLNGVLTQACVAGIATFTGVSFGTTGVFSLAAVAPTLTPALSNPVTVFGVGVPIVAPSSVVNNNVVQQGSNGVSPTTIIGAAVGGGLGLICCIAFVVGGFIFYREKKLRDEEKNYVYNPNIHLTAPGEVPIATMPLADIQRLRMDTVRE